MSSHLLIKAKAPLSLLECAADIAHDIEKKLSAYQEGSELSRINKNAGKHSVKCSRLTIDIIKVSLEISEATKGVFDPSIGCLTQKAYGFGTDKERLISKSEKKRLKALVNYKDIELNEDSVYLKKEGMALDLGGIGKGYAADKIIEFLKAKGVKEVLVSVGGEIYTYGKVWHLGIQHPRQSALYAQITTTKKDTLLTSSGDYERYIQDPSHHHILNPFSGESVNLCSSLSLVSNTLDAGRMDALNTALFQMSKEEISVLCHKYDISALVIDKKMQSYMLNDLEGKIDKLLIV
ncbi:FAD:protein FMN transferase [Sulfurimonas sp. MAG313]|nr:FAD:protein FMN transferase [Sulfurimonas sp. MAG313]MDF1880407.1 FAD:protein FMN transferase [Sulfurimonas sp. MAG313]